MTSPAARALASGGSVAGMTDPRDDETTPPTDDLDGIATLPGVRSATGAEKAGTPEQEENERREAAAPDPADSDVASDDLPAVPGLDGITASDREV